MSDRGRIKYEGSRAVHQRGLLSGRPAAPTQSNGVRKLTKDVAFNVLEHELVPEHYLLNEEEIEEVLEKLGITKDQLPKIKRTDMAIKVLESAYDRSIEPGEVVKIIRKSSTAGEFIAYRLVVGS